MFEPLFQTIEPSMSKTAAPIALLRKLAAEGVPKEEREKQIKKEIVRASNQQAHASGPGALAGMLGGGVLGGVAAHKLAPGSAPLGAYAGMVGGGLLGARIGGGAEGQELSGRIGSLLDEQKTLGAMKPGSTTPLSEENLDREGYHAARAQNAAAQLETQERMKPIGRGQLLGTLAGAGIGAAASPMLSRPYAANTLSRIHHGGVGAIGGSLLGAGAGFALMNRKDRQGLGRSFNRANKTEEKRNTIWSGANALDKESSAPVEVIRKVAQAISFDALTQPEPLSTEDVIFYEKIKAADADLLKIATDLSIAGGTSIPLEIYESLGGTYKHAFGQQMFNSQQMAGSPATSGGMSRRSTTPMPAPAQASPVRSPATSSPKSQAQGASSMPSATAQSPAPAAAPMAAPAAPTV